MCSLTPTKDSSRLVRQDFHLCKPCWFFPSRPYDFWFYSLSSNQIIPTSQNFTKQMCKGNKEIRLFFYPVFTIFCWYSQDTRWLFSHRCMLCAGRLAIIAIGLHPDFLSSPEYYLGGLVRSFSFTSCPGQATCLCSALHLVSGSGESLRERRQGKIEIL